MAVAASLEATNRHLGLLAENRFLKLESQIEAQIFSGARARGTTATAAHVEHLSKEVAEDIADVLRTREGIALETISVAADACMTVAIIGSTFLWIGKNLIGLAGFFELLF